MRIPYSNVLAHDSDGRSGRTIRDIEQRIQCRSLIPATMAAKKRKRATKKAAKKKAYYSGRKEKRAKKR